MDQREYGLEHAKYLAWERDAFNRLYYGLWIVFLGGFILSLHVTITEHFCVAHVLVGAFRFLAVLGTAVNFLMQYFAIRSLSKSRDGFLYQTFEDHDSEAAASYKESRRWEVVVTRCETALQVIGAAYLTIAFVGSFLVTLP